MSGRSENQKIRTLPPAQLSRMAAEWQHYRLPPKFMTLRIESQLARGGKMRLVSSRCIKRFPEGGPLTGPHSQKGETVLQTTKKFKQ